VADILRHARPPLIELRLAEHARIHEKCLRMKYSMRRNQNFGEAVGLLAQSMDSFLLFWSSIHRLHPLLKAVESDAKQLLPAQDAPPGIFDEPPSPFDLRIKELFKQVRSDELEYIDSIGVAWLLSKIESLMSAATALNITLCSQVCQHEQYLELSERGVHPNMSTYDLQVELANAMRDVRGFCHEFTGHDFLDATIIEEVRRRAAEADMLWNEWQPLPAEIAYAAIVREEQMQGGHEVLQCIVAGGEYRSMYFNACGLTEERFIRAMPDGYAMFGVCVSDWAPLLLAGRGQSLQQDKNTQRMHYGMCDAVPRMDLEDNAMIPHILQEWPGDIAFHSRPATAAEALCALHCASGLSVGGVTVADAP